LLSPAAVWMDHSFWERAFSGRTSQEVWSLAGIGSSACNQCESGLGDGGEFLKGLFL